MLTSPNHPTKMSAVSVVEVVRGPELPVAGLLLERALEALVPRQAQIKPLLKIRDLQHSPIVIVIKKSTSTTLGRELQANSNRSISTLGCNVVVVLYLIDNTKNTTIFCHW